MNPHSVGDTQKASGLASLAEGTHLPNAIFGSASPRRRALSNPRPLLEEVSIVMPKSTAPRAPPVTPPRKPIQAANLEKRSASPDLATMIAKTPRPRRRSLATTSPASRLLSRSGSANAVPSSWKKKASVRRDDVSVNVDYGTVLRGDLFTNPEVDLDEEDHLNNELDGDGSESDSSIDLHTPLPHLMFRDGLLSPRSKLLPQVVTPSVFGEPDIAVDANRSESVLSVVSTTGTAKTKTGFFKDPRDTQRRRVRHRDGRLLRAGMGLTTGLGWSDSEDEDAPSTLTRRLIHTSIAKGPPLSPISSRPSSQLVEGTTQESTSPIQRSFLKKVPLTRSASTSFSWVHPDKSEPVAPNEGSIPVRARAQSNASASTASIYSMASLRRTPPLDTSDPSVSTRSRTTSSASVSSASTSVTSSAPVPKIGIPDKPPPNVSKVGPSCLRRPTVTSSQQPKFPVMRSRTVSVAMAESASVGTAVPRTGAGDKPTLGGAKSRRRTQSSVSAMSGSSTASSSPTPVARRPRGFSKSNETPTPTTNPKTRSASISVSVPRPLRLPQTAALHPSGPRLPSIAAHRPKQASVSVSTSASTPPERARARARTLSSSESVSILAKVAPPPAMSVKPASTLTLQRSASALVRARPMPPPVPGHRARPSLPGPGPRLKPRTGTGMAYRTTSYSSLHATALSMHAVPGASPSADAGLVI